jgi:hypothetical protein
VNADECFMIMFLSVRSTATGAEPVRMHDASTTNPSTRGRRMAHDTCQCTREEA